MRWRVHGKRRVYRSPWVDVWLDEVQIGNGHPFEHHVLRMPKPAVAVVAVQGGEVLLLWRHRFATDAWGWEVPAGWAEPGEDLADAAAREVSEETGWRAGRVEQLLTYNTLSGISSMQMHTFLATDLTPTGDDPDAAESSEVAWHPLTTVPDLIGKGEIVDGTTLAALSVHLLTRERAAAAPSRRDSFPRR